MLSLSHVQRIFLARAPTDMRKQALGLAGMVMDALGKDPLSGDAYVFLNRHRTIVKILVWDVSGYWVACKRLESGRFAGRRWIDARDAHGSIGLSVSELMSLLEGIDVRQAAYHQHYAAVPTRLNDVESPDGKL
jgi:transposase